MGNLQQDALEILNKGLKAVDPKEALLRHLKMDGDVLRAGEKSFNLEDIGRVIVIGAGKAGASMAAGIEEILGDRVAGGMVVTKYGYTAGTCKVVVKEANHPIPDQAGVDATAGMLELLNGLTPRDLVICLISGGGSALLIQPAEGITLSDKQAMTDLLLKCGAEIGEINAVRKHLSKVKGGMLARLVYPAQVLGLILSDVIGDPLDVIASGPMSPDSSTFARCMEVIDKYKLGSSIPPAVRERLEKGAAGELEETPKSADPVFAGVHPDIIGSNYLALQGAAKAAARLGYNSLILTSFLQGEAREAARAISALAREVKHSGQPLAPPCCLILGGETTVTIHGEGLGGRNQELALAAALDIEGMKGVLILSAGTDGTDGPTDAAGAFVTGDTIKKAAQKGIFPMNYLNNNDSYHFFEALGDLIKTGPTNTNVMDLILVMVE
jgi:glycerate 2-kinase